MKPITFEEYLALRKYSNDRYEYNGTGYLSPTPNTVHQRISMRLSVQLGNLLMETDCEVIAAPYDIVLSDKENEEVVILPDLSVICDTSGFDNHRYVGVPDLIIEIFNPTNQAHDIILKSNLYQTYKVKEYWIINPSHHYVQVFTLNDEG